MRNIEDVRRFFDGDRYAVEVTGVKIDEIDDCYSKCSLELDERHYGAHGQVMGGVMFTLADFAFAVATNTPEGRHSGQPYQLPNLIKRQEAFRRVQESKRGQKALLL